MTTTKKKVKNFRSKVGRKTTVADLSEDLVREIFSRVPLASLNAVRYTCKTWNEISRNLVLGQKAAKKQFLAFMMVGDSSVCSLRFEHQGIRNDEDLAEPSVKPISIPNHDQVAISKVYHCDGLLLCVSLYPSRLLLWNPYLGKTRFIPLVGNLHFSDEFALGYDNNRNHKITRFSGSRKFIDVYDSSSDSWRVLDLERGMRFRCRGVSLKGNTYFCGHELGTGETEDNLLCFDFTRERFGPGLPLPSNPFVRPYDNVTLSFVSDDKLALLYDNCTLYDEKIDIWITTKIEPNAVLWSKFLRLHMKPLNGFLSDVYWDNNGKSFFIDEEKKVAVIFDIYKDKEKNSSFKMAYIIREDGCFRSINMGEVGSNYCRLVWSCYVPSLVQLHV